MMIRQAAKALSRSAVRSNVPRSVRNASAVARKPGADPFDWDAESHWKDYTFLDSQLTEDEVMIKDAAAQFAEAELMPMVAEGFRNETFDKGIFKAMGETGLLGSFIDGYGCAGASYTSYGLIAREVERVDSAYRSALSVQSSLVMHPINTFGSDEQKERFFAQVGHRRTHRLFRVDRA